MAIQERLLTLQDLQTWRRQVVQTVLRAVIVIGIPAVVIGSYDAYISQINWVIPIYVGVYIVTALTVLVRRVPFALQGGVLVSMVYVLGILDLVSAGLAGDALLYLIAFPFLTVMFFGRREGILALILVTLAMVVFGWAFSTGRLVVPVEKQAVSTIPVRWLSSAAALIMLGILLVGSQSQLLLRLTEALTQSRRLAQEEEQYTTAERERRDRLQATVQKYVNYALQVGQGNLNLRLDLDGDGQGADDPLVVLGRQLNEMTTDIQRMIAQVRDAANNLSSAATEIMSATTQQASGASEQSAAISQTTTTVDEVKTIAELASLRAQEVANAAQRTVDVSRSGQRAVQDTIESMEQIKERVEGIAENILALAEQTQQIGEIIATVNDIASQSNILALNASIEAARAGEHGKGFAVVAVEVRNLAEQSRQATAQVKAILSEIQRATNATVMATEEGTKRVDKGMPLAAQARQAIEQLSGVINESAQSAMQMVAGGRQQVSGIEQIALAMQNINQATIQSLTSTRQAERSAQSLSELARALSQTVAQYQL